MDEDLRSWPALHAANLTPACSRIASTFEWASRCCGDTISPRPHITTRSRLRAMTARAGKPEAFHQTITIAFLALIAERMQAGAAADFLAFERANPDLMDRSALARWYRPERLALAGRATHLSAAGCGAMNAAAQCSVARLPNALARLVGQARPSTGGAAGVGAAGASPAAASAAGLAWNRGRHLPRRAARRLAPLRRPKAAAAARPASPR